MFPETYSFQATLEIPRANEEEKQKAAWYPNHTLRSKLPASQANYFMKHAGEPVEVRADFLPDDSDFGMLNDIFNFRPSVD